MCRVFPLLTCVHHTAKNDIQRLKLFLSKCGSLDMKRTEAKLPEDKAHALSEVGGACMVALTWSLEGR